MSECAVNTLQSHECNNSTRYTFTTSVTQARTQGTVINLHGIHPSILQFTVVSFTASRKCNARTRERLAFAFAFAFANALAKREPLRIH